MQPLEDIEDALIAHITANVTGMKTVKTHEKDFDEQTLRSLMPLTPFSLIRYGGTTPEEGERGSEGASGMKKRSFTIALGAMSLRTISERQRGCYELLDSFRDVYDGLTLIVNGEQITLCYDGDSFLFTGAGITVYGMILSWFES